MLRTYTKKCIGMTSTKHMATLESYLVMVSHASCQVEQSIHTPHLGQHSYQYTTHPLGLSSIILKSLEHLAIRLSQGFRNRKLTFLFFCERKKKQWTILYKKCNNKQLYYLENWLLTGLAYTSCAKTFNTVLHEHKNICTLLPLLSIPVITYSTWPYFKNKTTVFQETEDKIKSKPNHYSMYLFNISIT
jgi:hypothetical protein